MIRPYWQASRAPRYSLLFALPLLIIYQILAALAPPAPGGTAVRNGADIILESVFVWLAGAWGPRLFMLCLIGVGAWLIAKDVRKTRSAVNPSVLGGMLLESIGLALVGSIAWGAAKLLGWRPLVAGTAATILGALIFSAFHYIGPYGDRFDVFSFVFRTIAGLFFSGLYLWRGFGITAWTDALYDVFLLLR